ncbi:MAG: carbohydrate kinase family protein [Defluviitaleaceae bacterium]|nr:carbohydrate kinase family protein [Defluviitaleaceae bacterium]
MKDILQSLYSNLESNKGQNLSMVIGLDGFVDEIIHLVDKRHDFETFTRILTIADFGERISRASGLGTNIEMVPMKFKLGGNGPILSNALLSYGVKLTYIGALGDPTIHPVFEEMVGKCEKVYSLCDPGHSDAVEFDDGKIIMGKLTGLNSITWEKFKSVVGTPKEIAAMIDKCDLFGMENWTMVPYMSQIWQGLIDEVFPLLSNRPVKPLAFFDLADPEKRNKEDILAAMKLIAKFESNFRAVLGLNEKELFEIAKVFGIEDDGIQNTTVKLYNQLGIYCLVVHPIKEACCCINGRYYEVEGPFCEKPVLTTGAGDNFNTGFCFGQALGLDPVNSLALGVCTSGFYVRNAKSPTYEEVMNFVKQWAENGSI